MTAANHHHRQAPRPSQQPAAAKSADSWIVGGLVAVALAASVVMIATESTAALQLALIAALWAAVAGIFFTVRYRRQAAEAQAQLSSPDPQATAAGSAAASAASAPAASASAATSLGATSPAPTGSDVTATAPNSSTAPATISLSADDAAVLADIRRELSAIREHIAQLSGREVTFEPAAVQADASRIFEIESGEAPAQPAAAADAQREAADLDSSAYAASSVDEAVDLSERSFGAPSAAVISGKLGDIPRNPLSASVAEAIARAQAETDRAQAAVDHLEAAPVFNTGSFDAVRWDSGGIESPAQPAPAQPAPAQPAPAHQSPTQQSPVQQSPAAAEEDHTTVIPVVKPESRRGRRRRDDNASALSVAELLAAQKDKS